MLEMIEVVGAHELLVMMDENFLLVDFQESAFKAGEDVPGTRGII